MRSPFDALTVGRTPVRHQDSNPPLCNPPRLRLLRSAALNLRETNQWNILACRSAGVLLLSAT
jgi:hypothetical protein